MYFIGGLKLTDKRVDKQLIRAGIVEYDIFYSPISTWFMVLLVIAAALSWLLIELPFYMYSPFIVLYFVAGYLINSYTNNSFAVTWEELIVVNPNFPFRKITRCSLKDIDMVSIKSTKNTWMQLLCIFGRNYIEVHTAGSSKAYYCIGLEMDAFDENWTEKTMEDFGSCLAGKGIKTLL